jgi:hypothetical protein
MRRKKETYGMLSESKIKRDLIKDDTKMFAQADRIEKITHFLTGDKKCDSVHNVLDQKTSVQFNLISLHTPFHQCFGLLDLEANTDTK